MLETLANTPWQSYLPALLFIVWALLHSFFADPHIKLKVKHIIGDSRYRWYRLVYVLLSIVTLSGIFWLLFRSPGPLVWEINGVIFWALNGLRLAAFILFLITGAALDMGDFLGFRALKTKGQSNTSAKIDLVTSGAYGIVRHPLYSLGLVLLWANPRMSAADLAFAAAASLYLWLGSYHEEISLRKEFGKRYVQYSRRVPRLIPWPFRRWNE